MATWEYGIARNSAIRNAAAPMMGGMMIPPVEADASMAAATWGRNPVFVIMGMVIHPSTMTLATALPLMLPDIPLATTETLAGPPRNRPMTHSASSVKNWAPPTAKSVLPRRTKAKTMVAG